VQTSHAELSAQFRTAQSLAAELEAANQRLAVAAREADAARREAEEANRAKSDFLATMSHEIRTPINAIIGYTDLLQLGVSGPITEGQQAQLERVRVSGRHLMGLVDQVLDLSRIETNTLAVDMLTARLAEAVRMALTVLRPEADQRGVRISADCGDELRYEGDPQHVGQVLVNLLSNAIKFSPTGGEVRLTCETRPGQLPRGGAWGRWVCACVHDQGPGVPEDQAARIFEPFVQAETGYTRRHGGAGLGLAISLRLAHSMGGDLTLESRPGDGATFVLWLPMPAEP
jgi:signal transduction histidine kinase